MMRTFALICAALLTLAAPLTVRADTPEAVPFSFKQTDEGVPNVVDDDCTYGTRGAAAHFRIELNLRPDAAAQRTAIVGVTFWNQSDVPQTELLRALAAVLGAKGGVPAPARRALSLRFDASTIGVGLTRLPNATFTENPAGDWLVLRLFLPMRDNGTPPCSFYVDLNTQRSSGLIEADDDTPGDCLLAPLATVL